MASLTVQVQHKVFTLPATLNKTDQVSLKKALSAYVKSHKRPSESALGSSLFRVFNDCVRTPSSTAIPSSSLKSRAGHAAPQIHHIKRAQEQILKEVNLDAQLLKNLAQLSQKCRTTPDSDRAIIDETITTIPKHLLNRLYFHLYLLHACRGKKTDNNYGEKAFRGTHGHSATNKERATAIHHLLLEQLASSFCTIGQQNSEALMKCFSTLPKEDRGAIYFQVFQLSKKPNPKDCQYGRNVFHSKDHSIKANRLRGEAIYQHLHTRLRQDITKALPANIVRDLESLRLQNQQLQQRSLLVQDNLAKLHKTNQELQNTFQSLSKTFGISAEGTQELEQLARDMAVLFKTKKDSLSDEERRILRTNMALMHIEEMLLQTALTVQFKRDCAPSELPAEPFSTRTDPGHAFHYAVLPSGIVTGKRTTKIDSSLSKEVFNHLCDTIDKAKMTDIHAYDAAIRAKIAETTAPGAVLPQIEQLEASMVKFANKYGYSSTFPAKPSHVHGIKNVGEGAALLFQKIMKTLGQHASAKIAEQEAIQKANVSGGADSAELVTIGARTREAIQLFETRHAAQLQLEQQIHAAEQPGSPDAENIPELRSRLRRLALQENIYYALTTPDATLARDLLQLEYFMNRVSIGEMRQKPQLRQALSLVEQLRPLLTGLLETLHKDRVFEL